MPTNPTSQLSQENILRDVHDSSNQTLRTTAIAVVDTVVVATSYESDSMALGDPNTNGILKINADGTIDANVIVSASGGDTIAVSDGTNILAVNADGSINVVGTPPVGASTEAKQDVGNTSLASIDSKTPALGQALAASSVPVVLTASQLSTLTPLSTVTANAGSGTFAISATSLPLPTGAATSADQTTANTSLASIDGKLTTTANGLKIDGSGVSQPVTPSYPINTNGSIVNQALTTTTASSASAPANSIGFIFEAPSTNTDNIRWCIGGTASTTVGMLMEPGRDTGFIPCSATISVCSTVSGTNAYSIQWILKV